MWLDKLGPFEIAAGAIIIALLLIAGIAIREEYRRHKKKPKRPTKDDTIGNGDDPRVP